MLSNAYIRIILTALVFFSILNGWWFVAVPLLVIGTWLFSFSLEWIVAGVAYDSLFGIAPDRGWEGYIGTIVAVIAVVASRALKRLLRSRSSMIV